MSTVDHLLETRTPLELAKDLVRKAKENVVLRDTAGRLEHEVFWLRAKGVGAQRPEQAEQLNAMIDTLVICTQAMTHTAGQPAHKNLRVEQSYARFALRNYINELREFP